jgi:hypothetical protein
MKATENQRLMWAAEGLLAACYSALNLEQAARLGNQVVTENDPTREGLDVTYHMEKIRLAIAEANRNGIYTDD